MTGFRFITSGVLKPEDQSQKYVDKVISPSYMYDKAFYPDSMSGSLYVLPRATIECLYSASLQESIIKLADRKSS